MEGGGRRRVPLSQATHLHKQLVHQGRLICIMICASGFSGATRMKPTERTHRQKQRDRERETEAPACAAASPGAPPQANPGAPPPLADTQRPITSPRWHQHTCAHTPSAGPTPHHPPSPPTTPTAPTAPLPLHPTINTAG